MRFTSSIAVALCAAVASAQTFTNCNPMEKECPKDPALGMSMNQTFNADSKLSKGVWNVTAKAPKFTDDGMVFELNEKGESVNIQSQFYIFWGTYEVVMKVSPGAGLISTSVMLSDTLDEIDWEIIGNNGTGVETNYYGKGNQTQANAIYYNAKGLPQDDFHNYTVHWTQDKTEWILDSKVVRTMAYGEALEGGQMYPQTPMHLNLGLWSAGDSDREGTVAWAGGKTDWSKAPYTMTIKSLRIVDGTSGASAYTYGDKTGSFKSINVEKEGKSDQADRISNPNKSSDSDDSDDSSDDSSSDSSSDSSKSVTESVSDKYNGLSQGAKIAVIAAPLGAVALAIIIGCFCCVKQRKLGLRERAIEDARWEKENAEMMAYRKQMTGGVFSRGSSYQPAPMHSPRPF